MENISSDTQIQQQSVAPQQPTFDPTKQGNSKKIIIVALVSLLFVMIVLGLFVVLGSNKSVLPTVTPGIKTQIITPVPTIPTASPIKMTLTKGKVVPIPTTDITIEYVGASVPNPKCFDCISTTDLAVIKNDIRKILSYSCGGIAGKCIDSNKEFDIEVVLENANEAIANVTIKK